MYLKASIAFAFRLCLSYLLFLTNASEDCRFTEDHTRTLMIGETKTEQSMNITKNSSLRWTYKTRLGYNLTAKISLNQFKKEVNCNEFCSNEAHLSVNFWGDEAFFSSLSTCCSKMEKLRNPIVLGNLFQMTYCHVIGQYSVKVEVTTRIAGFIYVTADLKQYEVPLINEAQWMALKNEDITMPIRLKIMNFNVNTTQSCKNGYLKIKNKNKVLYSRSDGGSKNMAFVFYEPLVNITFECATFLFTTQLMPAVAHLRAPAATTKPPLAQRQGQASNNNVYLYLGFVLVAILLLLLLFLVLLFYRRRKRRNERKSKNQNEEDTRRSDVFSNDTNAPMMGNEDWDAHRSRSGRNQVEADDEVIESMEPHPAKQEDISSDNTQVRDKRQIRLSQLADKYIDMEVSPIRDLQSSIDTRRSSHEQNSFQGNRRRSQPTKEQVLGPRKPLDDYEHISSAVAGADYGRQWRAARCDRQFNDYDQVALDASDRFPLSEHCRNETSQGYEPVCSSTIENETIVLPEVYLNEVPIGNYEPFDISPKSEQTVVNNQSSRTTTDGYEPIFPMNVQPSPFHGSRSSERKSFLSSDNNSLSSVDFHKSRMIAVGSDGYLSSDSMDSLVVPIAKYERTQSLAPASSQQSGSDHIYVSPNLTSNESLSKHFMKPIPKPGISMSVTSLPDLYAESQTPESPQKEKPKPAARRKAKSPLALTEDDQKSNVPKPVPSFRSVKNAKKKANRYNVPRPSAPAIFIQSAYTTDDDVRKIQEHLEMIAVADSPNLSAAESEGTMFVPKRGSMMLYDSPRASPWNSPTSTPTSSEESLHEEKNTSGILIYDIPRPSVSGHDEVLNRT